MTVTLLDLAEADEVFLARAQQLKVLELLDESPWDGVEDREKSIDFLGSNHGPRFFVKSSCVICSNNFEVASCILKETDRLTLDKRG